MFEICLLMLPWAIDPAFVDDFKSNGRNAISTCARPTAKVIQPGTVSAISATNVTDASIVAKLLRRWESATRQVPEWSRSQREEFRRMIPRDFNEHSVAATEQLIGPVNAERLIETYDWRIVERTDKGVCIDAVPRDETERLFYGSLRVSLDSEVGIPAQIFVVGRDHHPRVVWQSDEITEVNRVQLVQFENDVPPAPRSLLRTANARAD